MEGKRRERNLEESQQGTKLKYGILPYIYCYQRLLDT